MTNIPSAVMAGRESDGDEKTDEDGTPVENPSG